MRELKVPITTTRHYLLLVGYSIFLALTATLLWGGYVPFLTPYLSNDNLVVVDFFIRWFSLPFVLLIVATLTYHKGNIADKFLYALPFISLTVAALVFLMIGYLSNATLIQVIAIGLSCGVGCSLLFILFQLILATQDVYAAGFIIIVSAVLSPILHFVLSMIPDNYTLIICFLLLTPICAFLFFQSKRDIGFAEQRFQNVPSQDKTIIRTASRVLFEPLLGISLSAFVIGLMQVMVMFGGDARLINTIKMFGMLVSGLILSGVWISIYPRFSPEAIYRVVFPLTATAYLLLPFLGSGFFYAFVTISFLIFAIVSALMVITCLQVSRDFSLQPMFVYGIFAGIVYLAAALGSVVGYVFMGTGNFGLTQLLIIALIAVYILTFVLILAKRKQQDKASQVPDFSIQGSGSVSDTIIIRCQQIQETFSLSERETEIAVLLACGRDAPAIAKKLFISENTVRTHMKNFYKKLDVHNKQDFLNLLDEEVIKPE